MAKEQKKVKSAEQPSEEFRVEEWISAGTSKKGCLIIHKSSGQKRYMSIEKYERMINDGEG